MQPTADGLSTALEESLSLEQLDTDHALLLDELFLQLEAIQGHLPLAPGQTIGEFFDELAMEVIGLLADLDETTNPTEEQLKHLGLAYIGNWSAEIDQARFLLYELASRAPNRIGFQD